MKIEGTIMVIGAHTDDTVLGAGASMCKWIGEGVEVFDVTFSLHRGVAKNYSSYEEMQTEHFKAMHHIGVGAEKQFLFDIEACHGDFQRNGGIIREILEEYRDKYSPSTVITHSRLDSNQDHVTVYEEVYRTFKRSSSILTFDFIPNTMRMPQPQFLVQVTRGDVATKASALGFYASQQRKDHGYMTPGYTYQLARVRGLAVEFGYAEAFHVEQIRA